MAIAHDPVFVSLSASPSTCEVFADTSLASSGIAVFPGVILAGYIGHCSLSFQIYFAGGQMATMRTLDAAVNRNTVSPFIDQILPATESVMVDAPFIVSRENSATTSKCFIFTIYAVSIVELDDIQNTIVESNIPVHVSSQPCALTGDTTKRINSIGTATFLLSATKASGPCLLTFNTPSSNKTFQISINVVAFMAMDRINYFGTSKNSTKCKNTFELAQNQNKK